MQTNQDGRTEGSAGAGFSFTSAIEAERREARPGYQAKVGVQAGGTAWVWWRANTACSDAVSSRALYRGSFERASLDCEGCWDKPPRA